MAASAANSLEISNPHSTDEEAVIVLESSDILDDLMKCSKSLISRWMDDPSFSAEIPLKYERIGIFCNYCGHIGHEGGRWENTMKENINPNSVPVDNIKKNQQDRPLPNTTEVVDGVRNEFVFGASKDISSSNKRVPLKQQARRKFLSVTGVKRGPQIVKSDQHSKKRCFEVTTAEEGEGATPQWALSDQ
ncbi:hypothetical protein PIB30_068856 [Stylosanthes scabra]|uniref:Zinc knuckle CX2CX4HX4C domain-containing protein n=1 Tax=Stylosanthes scabra TaxID=79078 RepID=A0ABU6TPL1_9FABA|nr:hypothetical protein [Stylosanthes scabra]